LSWVLKRQMTASLSAEILLNRPWMMTVKSVSTSSGLEIEDSLIKEASIGAIFNRTERGTSLITYLNHLPMFHDPQQVGTDQ
jgi:hypothetical protein